MKLQHHPQGAPTIPMAVAARVERGGRAITFTYSLSAPEGAVRVAESTRRGRADGLWQTTCFEAFVRGDGERYAELNFSPSGQWAAYAFEARREGMHELGVPEPMVQVARELGQLTLTASVALPDEFNGPGSALALCAVVEEMQGTKSYWALTHGEGTPDFHHPDCFAAKLP